MQSKKKKEKQAKYSFEHELQKEFFGTMLSPEEVPMSTAQKTQADPKNQ